MNLKQAQKFLKDNKVRYVLAQFVDIHGVAKTKSVPVSHFEDILKAGAGFAGFAVWGFGMAPHSADYLAVGDLDTLSLVPWQPGYARIVCDGRVNGKPYPFDTRFVLKNQVAKAKAKGWTVNVGIEPEFMLLKKQADGSLAPADDGDTLDGRVRGRDGLAGRRAVGRGRQPLDGAGAPGGGGEGGELLLSRPALHGGGGVAAVRREPHAVGAGRPGAHGRGRRPGCAR
jgi:glutamine synthetase